MVKIYNKKELGKAIERERKSLKDSLETFAQKIKVSRQTLARWEKGEGVGPSVTDLLRMCEVFRCDFGYLVGEYACRTREATDIHAATGLSEKAITRLEVLRLLDDDESIGLISDLLINPYFTTAIQEFIRAKSFKKSCKHRDTQKMKLKDNLKKVKMERDEQSSFLQQFHIETNDLIMGEHHAERIELSPDDMAQFYFMAAKDSFISAITDMMKRSVE